MKRIFSIPLLASLLSTTAHAGLGASCMVPSSPEPQTLASQIQSITEIRASVSSSPSSSPRSDDFVPLRTGPSPMRTPSKPWTRNWVAVACKDTDSSVVLTNYGAGPAPGKTLAGSGVKRGATGTAHSPIHAASPRLGSCPRDGIQMDEEAANLYATQLDSCIRGQVLRDRDLKPSDQIYSEAIYPTELRTVNNDHSNSHPVTDIWKEADRSCSLHGSGRAVDLFRIHVGGVSYDYEKSWNRGNPTAEWNDFWMPLSQCMSGDFYVITADMDSKHFNHMHLGLAWPSDGPDYEEWMDKFAGG